VKLDIKIDNNVSYINEYELRSQDYSQGQLVSSPTEKIFFYHLKGMSEELIIVFIILLIGFIGKKLMGIREHGIKEKDKKRARYDFEHRVLPGMFYAETEKLIGSLGASGNELLREFYFINKHKGNLEEDKDESIYIENLDVVYLEDFKNVIFIKFHQTGQQVDCIYSAFVFGESLHYLTLEIGEENQYYFCEWTDERIHNNYLQVSSSDLESFSALVKDYIEHDGLEIQASFNPNNGDVAHFKQ